MFLKITFISLIFLPAFLKAEEQETIKKRSVYKKSIGKFLAPRSIKKDKEKSFGELTLDLAKQHLLQQIQKEHSAVKDFSNEVNEHSSDKCTKLKKVGDPIVHHHSGTTQGAWMRDPLGILGPEKIWYMNGFHGSKTLLEFDNMNKFKAGIISKTYDLPFKFDGTGAVVYGTNLYYNKENTNVIVQYNLVTESVTKEVVPYGSVRPRQNYYQWNGYTTFDLSVDESGLWVMYAYGNNGKLSVAQLDPLTMTVLHRYHSFSSESMKTMGNAFVACGIVYMIDNFNGKTTTINYAYDTTTNLKWNPNIKFANKFGYNSMVTYNPHEKVLYAWDNRRQITYPLEFEVPI